MAEVFGIAASAVGFVGLAGQILQGCQTVRSFLQDIRYASSDINKLRKEIETFQSTLKTFRKFLVEFERSSTNVSPANEQITHALEYSSEAVRELQNLVAEYKEQNLPWKKKMGAAFAKEKIDKELRILERAKLHVLAAQVNSNLAISHISSVETRQTRETLAFNTEVLTTASETLSVLPSRLQELETVISATGDTVQSIRQDLFVQLTNMPPILKGMIEDTLGDAIATHFQKFNSHASNGVERLSEREITENALATNLSFGRTRSQRLGRRSWTQRRRTWFGSVVMSSTEMLCECQYESSATVKSTSRTFRIEITPNRLLLRLGILLTFHRPYEESGFLASDMRMRVYKVVSVEAPILQACDNGCLEEVQQLIRSGKATPFDRPSGQTTLLDTVLNQMWTTFNMDLEYITAYQTSLAVQKLRNLLLVYNYLIKEGLDPNTSSSGFSYLGYFVDAALTCQVPELLIPMIDLASIMMTTETEDSRVFRTTLDAIKWWLNFLPAASPCRSLFQSALNFNDQTQYSSWNPYYAMPQRSSTPLSINIWNLRAAVMRDPEAIGLRSRLIELSNLGLRYQFYEILRFVAKIPYFVGRKKFCELIRGKEVRRAAEAYLKVGIEFGLPLEEVSWDDMHLRLYVLGHKSFRDSPLRRKIISNPVPEWLDMAGTASLAFQLFYLSQPKDHMQLNEFDRIYDSSLVYDSNGHKVVIGISETIRKRLRYYKTWPQDWVVYLEAYDRKDWDYHLSSVESSASVSETNFQELNAPTAKAEAHSPYWEVLLYILYNIIESFRFLV